jgi:S1-C subfamily serine protease
MPRVLAVSFFLIFIAHQIAAQPISQREACERFSRAVVRIDAGGHSLGTGFLVSAEGFIFTAGHVITDETTGQSLLCH